MGRTSICPIRTFFPFGGVASQNARVSQAANEIELRIRNKEICMHYFLTSLITKILPCASRLPFENLVNAERKKKKKRRLLMYKENQNKFINIVHDDDIIHVFINAPSRNKKKIEQVLKDSFYYLSQIYYTTYEMEYDDEQFYFTVADYKEFEAFKNIFYRELRK